MTKQQFLSSKYVGYIKSNTELMTCNLVTLEQNAFTIHRIERTSKNNFGTILMLHSFTSRDFDWCLTIEEMLSVLINIEVEGYRLALSYCSDFFYNSDCISLRLDAKNNIFICNFGNASDENNSFYLHLTPNCLFINGTKVARLIYSDLKLEGFYYRDGFYLFRFSCIVIKIALDCNIIVGSDSVARLISSDCVMQKLIME